MTKKTLNPKTDYGLDAPGLVKTFLIGGIGFAFICPMISSAASADFFRILSNMGIAFSLSGVLMLLYSYFGKFRARDVLLRSLHLKGDETLLDLGCGRGLLMIGGAKRLPAGKAIGIDLWSQKDLSGNSREAVLKNASLEKVDGRVEIIEGDMRKLPLPDASVDCVVASMSIHNIPTSKGREEAVREAIRVLKPGGRIALLDFQSTALYAKTARDAGLVNVRRPFSIWCFPPSRIVYGEKPSSN